MADGADRVERRIVASARDWLDRYHAAEWKDAPPRFGLLDPA